ncbi:MAG: DUF1211 domain-containing protein [Methylobacteriaceae bacterium]|nr:DUF1211 domain-containing protein [Methylobacteriaceae bacterium]
MQMYPKARLDALTDGIFAVAMTLLVLELRVPEQELVDNAALWQALKDLWPKFFPYLLSFLVLGNSWLSKIRVRMAAEHVTRTYAVFWLANLLLVTCVPFSTMLVGRYADVPLAIWVYVGNLGLNGLTALAMVLSMRDAHETSGERRQGVIVLMVSCVLAAVIAPFAPQQALWALLLNALPVVAYRKSRRSA